MITRYAVIGNPIGHSLSPDIHLAFAAQVGLKISYDRILSDPKDFRTAALDFFKSEGIGLNVTAPFKHDAFLFVREGDSASMACGTVNTIHAVDDTLRGFNTDGIGLVADLKRLCWPLQGAKILVIGAGGAAQGIVLPLLEQGVELSVANRTKSRADVLKKQFSKINVVAMDELAQGWDVVINATAAGWHQEKLPVPDTIFEDARCYDLSYQRDGHTPFINQVEAQAAETSDGLGMLVEQAAEAFRIWHDVKPQTKPVLVGLRKPNRQFIAGALCPRCDRQDTLYVERDLLGNPTLRACHSCNFSEDVDGNVSVNLRK